MKSSRRNGHDPKKLKTSISLKLRRNSDLAKSLSKFKRSMKILSILMKFLILKRSMMKRETLNNSTKPKSRKRRNGLTKLFESKRSLKISSSKRSSITQSNSKKVLQRKLRKKRMKFQTLKVKALL